MTRVQVIASSAIVRAGLEAMLREDLRFAVVTASASPQQSRDKTADVLLVESDSVSKFLAPAGLIRDEGMPVVLLADHLSRAELRRLLHSGVRAVLPRDATSREILAAVEGAVTGLTVLSSDDMDALLPAGFENAPSEFVPGEELSSRELEVLAMLAEGLGNKDVAARLNISEHTVKFHVSSILGKLGASTRGEAVARGVREGLVVI